MRSVQTNGKISDSPYEKYMDGSINANGRLKLPRVEMIENAFIKASGFESKGGSHEFTTINVPDPMT